MLFDSGLRRIQKRLAAIPDHITAEVKAALEKSADEIVKMAKSLCPVDEGDLRDSIGWTWGDAPSGSMTIAQAIAAKGLTITIFAGDDEAYYARWVEFGTQGGVKGQRMAATGTSKRKRKSYRTHSGTAAQPFFFPAYRLNKKRAEGRIKRAVTKAIKANWGSGT